MVEFFEYIFFSVRILFGQLSAAMLLLLLSVVANRWRDWSEQRRIWMRVFLIIGAVFYPLALGLGLYDPYAWGYDHRLLMACAVCALLAAWRYPLMSLWLTLAAIAHASHWGESNNLWDYLIDPLTMLWALLWWLYERFRGVKHAKVPSV